MSVLPNETDWYQLEIDQTFKLLMANGTGLTSNEAEARLKRYGYNELKFKKRSPLVRFLLQFHNPLIYVLLVAGTITGVLSLRGEDMVGDTAVIFGVVILNVIIGFVQEGKGEESVLQEQ